MAQVRRTIECSSDRSCIVVLEPSGAELLLRPGQVMEISGELREGEEIEVEAHDNCYVVHVPNGGVSAFIAGASVNPPTSMDDIIELELAKLPVGAGDVHFSDESIAQIQTFDKLDELSPVSSAGKLGVFEIAAQVSMELFKLRPESVALVNFVAAVCRRVLSAGAILVRTTSTDFASGLWSAARSDLHLGGEPKSLRRLLASSCLYPKAMADAVSRWANEDVTQPPSPNEATSDVEDRLP